MFQEAKRVEKFFQNERRISKEEKKEKREKYFLKKKRPSRQSPFQKNKILAFQDFGA